MPTLPCRGNKCPCRPQRTRFPRCKSLAPVVVHLSTLRSRRQYPFTPGDNSRVVTKWWYHLERLGADRFESVRNRSCLLADAVLAAAQELQQRGEWSLAVDYVRVAREIQPMQPDSHVTKRKARKAATLPVDPTGAAGWRRFNAPAPALSTGVDQVVFFASNAVSPSDEVLLRHYQRQLAAGATSMQVHAQLWLMLMVTPTYGAVELGERTFESLGVPVLAWSEAGLHRGLPGLAAAVPRSLRTMALEKDPNHARYFFFHATLLLWHQVCGAREYPRLRYVWRLEPDVVFAGSLASLLELSARAPADLLLPRYWSYEDTRGRYLHWNITDAAMQGVPLTDRFWSLVSISRLSLSFLTRWLALSWSPYNATLVYEELGLPRVCLASDGCSLSEFGLSTQLGSRLLYKPTWACEEVLRSRRKCEDVLWHPVKDRECLAAFLEKIPQDVYDSPRYSCVGSRRHRASTRPVPPEVVWIGSSTGSRRVVLPEHLREWSKFSEGNYGPGLRHLGTRNGSFFNYG